MNKDESSKPSVEGEGSYSATRKYNQHVADSVDHGGLEAGAEAALRAIEGAEGAELKRAEQEAKQGPKPNAAAPAKIKRAT